MHVHRAFLDENVVTPDLIQQLRARVDALGMRHEEVQQPELGGSELDRLAVAGDAVARGIETQPPTSTRSSVICGARRRSTAFTRALSSRGENGLVM